MRKFVLGLDEGTTSLRAVLYDAASHKIVGKQEKTIRQHYPHDGWVEQDAEDIFKKILLVCKEVLKNNSVQKCELLGIAITNQRETIVAWDRQTGKPIYNAIVWQCRRTTNLIKALPQKVKKQIHKTTGLIANPYFSASKMKWILDNVPAAKSLAKAGNLCFGTIDSFLAFRLTGNHVTDTTNASRTMLMNLHTLDWDSKLLKIFDVPLAALPKILPSDGKFGNAKALLDAPILAMIGDQQSSMIGQGAMDVGASKVTIGTGGFVLTNVSPQNAQPLENLLLTVARTLGGKTEYAIEGSIFSACSAINWLKELGMYGDVAETSKMASRLSGNNGVYFVPAFTGLGAPYWKDDARACIVGMNFNTDKNHIVRACLESIAFNIKALVDEMRKNGQRIGKISVDGGGSKNDFLLQFICDMLGKDVERSSQAEATVMGAIYVALLACGQLKRSEIKQLTQNNQVFHPRLTEGERKALYEGWQKAIKKL